MKRILEPFVINMISLFSKNHERIIVPDFLLRGITVRRADFERDIQDDEECNADPVMYLDSGPDNESASWLQAFYRGEVRFVGVGARASFLIPGTSITASWGAWLWGIQSDSGEYIDEVYKNQCRVLEAELAEVGITVLPMATGATDSRQHGHTSLEAADGHEG